MIKKPTIGSAVASISKGIKQLDAVVVNAGNVRQRAAEDLANAKQKMDEAHADAGRAVRIKAKPEELIA